MTNFFLSVKAIMKVAVHLCIALFVILTPRITIAQTSLSSPDDSLRSWLAGDHHIHSRYSVGWDQDTDPPTRIVGGDAIYPIAMNALMAKFYGLSWMVSTDHGGPNHSKVNLEEAYPELVLSRMAVPEVIQFYGMEFDTPGADHSSLIIPHSHSEATHLHHIEATYNKREPYPSDPSRDTEAFMLKALVAIDSISPKPVVIANHPARSSPLPGRYGADDPEELRNWNDTAPGVAVGMEGAPGHQAMALNRDGSIRNGARGGYSRFPTLGGFDQMTAILGGFWDSMLGEGRRWWITSTSDSHINWREGGADFWPGEYSKTYVWAKKEYDDILDGIRNGRMFVVLGDLITELHVTASLPNQSANIGGSLTVPTGSNVELVIRFLDPATLNAKEENPSVARVDLIVGQLTGLLEDRTTDKNPTTRVAARFSESEWHREGDYSVITYTLENLEQDGYLRVRGTNGDEEEPEQDPKGENPWSDLWFYSNPIFLEVE